jgi:DNA-directed RNA polymerase subunit F
MFEFYAAYLKFCLADNKLSADELTNIKHLREISSINEEDASKIHNELTSSILKQNYELAVSDGKLTEQEKQFLEQLQKDMCVPADIAKRISEEVRTDYVNNFLKTITSDDRLSPDEERELDSISKSLNIELKMDEATRNKLQRLKLYWVIENGEPASIQTNINLTRNENCYFHAQVEWHEKRRVTKRIDYHGPVARIRIMKGVYYRIGSISPNVVSTEEWRHIDSGNLYLTNTRIIFMGSSKNSSIRLNKVLSFSPYSNGVEVDKDTGKNPFIKFSDNVDIFCLLLSRFMKSA